MGQGEPVIEFKPITLERTFIADIWYPKLPCCKHKTALASKEIKDSLFFGLNISDHGLGTWVQVALDGLF